MRVVTLARGLLPGALALAACASRRPSIVATSRTPPPTHAPMAAPSAPGVARTYGARPVFQRRHGCRVFDDGATRFRVFDHERIEHRGDDATVAEETLPMEPTWITRDARGWHFFAPRGRWFTPTFTGPLEPVLVTPRGHVGRGPGRAVQIVAGEITGLRVPGVVTDGAFLDALRGLAIVEPGVLLETGDGGLSWHHIPLDDDALEVEATAEALYVSAVGGSWRYDGATLAAGAPSQPRGCTDAESEDRPPQRPYPPASPVNARWIDPQRSALYDPTSGLVYDPARDAVLARVPPPCEGARLVEGSAFVAVCGETNRELTIHRRGPDTPWQPLATLRGCGGRCIASADGASVACEGRCDPRAECDGVPSACVVSADASVREHRVAESRPFRLIGLRDGTPLWISQRSYLSHVDFIHGNEAPKRLCPNVSDHDLRWWFGDQAPSLGSDGLLRNVAYTVGASEEPEYRLLVADPGVRCEWSALPGGTLRRARWCGGDGDAIAETSDGLFVRDARSGAWRASAAVRELANLESNDPLFDVRCNAQGAWSDSLGEHGFVGWGEPLPQRGTVGREAMDHEIRSHHPTPFWTCSAAGDPEVVPPEAPPPAGPGGMGIIRGRSALWVAAPVDGAIPGTRWLAFNGRGFDAGEDDAGQALAAAFDREGAWVVRGGADDAALWRLSRTSPAAIRHPLDYFFLHNDGALLAVADGVIGLAWRTSFLTSHWRLARVAPRDLEAHHLVLSDDTTDSPLLVVRRGAVLLGRWLSDGSVIGGVPRHAPERLAEPGPIEPCGADTDGAATAVVRLIRPGDDQDVYLDLSFAFQHNRLCFRGARTPGALARFTADGLDVALRDDNHVRRWRCARAPAAPR